VRLALGQIDPTVGDIHGNAGLALKTMQEAEEAGADLLALPELALTGYPPEDLLYKTSFVEENLEALEELARASGRTATILGFVDSRDSLYNAAALIQGGRVAGVYHKQLLPNYGVFDEARYFAPGSGLLLARVAGVRVGVAICEDAWYPEGPVLALGVAGAELVVVINASPYHMAKGEQRRAMLATRAEDAGVALAYVNMVGGQDELVFDGESMVFGPTGQLLARAAQFREDLLLVDLEEEELLRARLRDPRRRARRGAPEVQLVEVSEEPITPKPPLAREPRERLGPEEEVYQALLLGLRDYVRKNGFERVVIGLSGGIDSSLVATIAADALGPERVLGVCMPSPYTSRESLEDAREVAARLGIEFLVIPIGEVFSSYLRALEETFRGQPPGVAEENLQARIRGNLLMAISNKFGHLVLATGNKSEMATGYATLYGDMAGGFAVIKDVPKTLVYRLARWRNTLSPVIPERVLTKPPSAELRPGQRDTDTLPPYEVLDPILEAYVERDVPLESLARAGFDPATLLHVARLVDRSEYKRRQAPPGVRITPRAFGKDRRLPITNRFREELRPREGP
jgi:NAD+ synthase (glutamine-hydrolysing)